MTPKGKMPAFLEEWRASSDHYFTPTTYLNQPDGLPYVIATQWLYAPNFVEYRGGIFRAELALDLGDHKIIDDWFRHYNGDIHKVEWMCNWLILWDIFGACDTDAHDDDLVQLAETLRDTWDALLRVKFPDRQFVVEFIDDDDHGPQVTFHQTKRDAAQQSCAR